MTIKGKRRRRRPANSAGGLYSSEEEFAESAITTAAGGRFSSSSTRRPTRLHALSHYIDNPCELMHEVFRIVNGAQLRAMLPPSVRKLSLDELHTMCLVELVAMSRQQIRAVLAGESTDFCDTNVAADDVDVNSRDQIDQIKGSGDTLELKELEMRARVIKAMLAEEEQVDSGNVFSSSTGAQNGHLDCVMMGVQNDTSGVEAVNGNLTTVEHSVPYGGCDVMATVNNYDECGQSQSTNICDENSIPHVADADMPEVTVGEPDKAEFQDADLLEDQDDGLPMSYRLSAVEPEFNHMTETANVHDSVSHRGLRAGLKNFSKLDDTYIRRIRRKVRSLRDKRDNDDLSSSSSDTSSSVSCSSTSPGRATSKRQRLSHDKTVSSSSTSDDMSDEEYYSRRRRKRAPVSDSSSSSSDRPIIGRKKLTGDLLSKSRLNVATKKRVVESALDQPAESSNPKVAVAKDDGDSDEKEEGEVSSENEMSCDHDKANRKEITDVRCESKVSSRKKSGLSGRKERGDTVVVGVSINENAPMSVGAFTLAARHPTLPNVDIQASTNLSTVFSDSLQAPKVITEESHITSVTPNADDIDQRGNNELSAIVTETDCADQLADGRCDGESSDKGRDVDREEGVDKEDVGWSQRWMRSDKVQRVVNTSKMYSRLKNKLRNKKRPPAAAVDVTAATDEIPADVSESFDEAQVSTPVVEEQEGIGSDEQAESSSASDDNVVVEEEEDSLWGDIMGE